ncbi:MAG: hypothetical protein Q9227_001088 [Pyrenula ochraceoflavens]
MQPTSTPRTEPTPSGSNMSTPVDPLGIRMWPTPTQTPMRSHMGRPKTIHEGAFPTNFHFGTTSHPRAQNWDHFNPHIPEPLPHIQPEPTLPHQFLNFDNDSGGGHPDLHNHTPTRFMSDLNAHKNSDEHIEFPSLDSDYSSFNNDQIGMDENTPLINLRKMTSGTDESLNLESTLAARELAARRLSGSSFVSSTGAGNEFPDFTAFSDMPSYTSDYTPRSSLNLSVTPLSPVPSPRCPPPDTMRTGSRSRASPSPRPPSIRAAPYSLESARNKRWSTGSYGGSPARRASPFVYSAPEGFYPTQYPTQIPGLSRINSQAYLNSNFLPSSNLNNINRAPPMNAPPRFHRPASFMVPSTFDPTGRLEHPPPLPSHGLFRTLQSNADIHDPHLDPYADLADPPDLFGPLSEEQIPPSSEDMNPEDPEMCPHEQELRFENDLYTPRWVRGHGNKREGWCGICKPGRWLVLKNSAFWYDKSFTHGISAATGQAFEGPKDTRRMDGNAEVWEGLCGSCGEWIALVSSKKKGTTWFRHAYKCHTHAKIKDAPKRRRESSHRPSTANSSGQPPRQQLRAEPSFINDNNISASSMITEPMPSGAKTISSLQSISSII